MKTKRRNAILILFVTGIFALMSSCNKEPSYARNIPPSGKQSILVYMNDNPVPNLLKVLVDIKYIEVKVDTGSIRRNDDYYNDDRDEDNDNLVQDRFGKWDTLSITPRIYDLLKLKNGADTLIANSYVNIGKVTKLRITLGNRNAVWTDSTRSYPLPLCDNDPYIYVKLQSQAIDTTSPGQLRIRIDFDAMKSIEFENGQYCLKPDLKSYSDQTSGIIEGIVKPFVAHTLVKVYNNTDTAYAVPEDDGEYRIRGMKPAVYSVWFKPNAPYTDTTIMNVRVVAGQKTILPEVKLHY